MYSCCVLIKQFNVSSSFFFFGVMIEGVELLSSLCSCNTDPDIENYGLSVALCNTVKPLPQSNTDGTEYANSLSPPTTLPPPASSNQYSMFICGIISFHSCYGWIPLCIYTLFLSAHLIMENLTWIFNLSIVNSSTTHVMKQVSLSHLIMSLGIYPVGLLDYTVVLFPTFKEISITFSTVIVLIYIPSDGV